MEKRHADTAGAVVKAGGSSLRRGWLCPVLILCPPLLALALLWAGLPLLYPDSLRDTPGAGAQLYRGADFKAAVARRSSRQDDALVIQSMRPALHGGSWVGEAVFQLETTLRAQPYSQFRLNLEGLQPDQSVYLLWRSSSFPGQQQALELERDADGISWHSLPGADSWEGEISQLAIGVFGPPRSPALKMRGLELHGSARAVVARRMLWEWQQFKPWIQSSANRYPGFRGEIILPPAAAAGLWAGLSLLLLLAGLGLRMLLSQRGRQRAVGGPPRRAIVAAVLASIVLPWLALDGLWQGQLERQLQATRERFGGLTQAQKHTREDDARLQDWADSVKQQLAPLRGKRLFLLNDEDRGHQYHRLRLQFHLLPLNVYNFGRKLLPPGQMRPGDHVLLLQPASAVRFDPRSSQLEDGEYRYRATQLDSYAKGQLFRLEASLTPMEGVR